MSAALLWIGVPLMAAMVFWFLRRQKLLCILAIGALNLLLALLAWKLPIGGVINFLGLSIELKAVWTILGRSFVFGSGDHSFLMLIFGMGAFWYIGAGVAKVERTFAPLGLAVLAFLVAALAVQPFLYAALFIEAAVLFTVPMLVPPGQQPGKGILRFVIFQTMAMPFIMFAGWIATIVEANPTDQRLLLQAVLFMALGFAFWLAVFPFYSWVPLLTGEVNPYVAGFVLNFFPTIVFLLSLDFLNTFAWLREFSLLYVALRLIGAVMVVLGGIWVAFERELARMYGYAVIMENGFSLLALSLHSRVGLEIFTTLFLGRLLSLVVWGLALAILSGQRRVTLDDVEGLLYSKPVTAGAILAGCLSIAGLPLLAVFPMRLFLLEQLVKVAPVTVLWVFIGNIGLFVAGLRLVSSMARSDQGAQFDEKVIPAVFMALGTLAIIVVGVFPGWLTRNLVGLLDAFERLQ